MSSHAPAAEAVKLPAPGDYPVPDHHGKRVVERKWDGEIWTDQIGPAPDGTTLPAYKRHFFGFLHDGGWKLFLIFLITALGAAALWADDRKAEWVSGIQILMVPLAGIATLTVMIALVVRLIGSRVGFNRIAPDVKKSILKWGVLSAVVGFALAYGVEMLLPKLFGGDPKESGWSVLAGPAEETGKLLIPVILWIKGRFRIPREGYLLVLASASVFGIMEGIEYALDPKGWQPARPILEMMHPLLTGFVAAVAWQAAWHGRSIFTKAAIGAWVVAMLAHSTNDVIVLSNHVDGSVARLTSFITITVVALMYLLQKHSARNMVPPDLVGSVSRRWRPAAPKG